MSTVPIDGIATRPRAARPPILGLTLTATAIASLVAIARPGAVELGSATEWSLFLAAAVATTLGWALVGRPRVALVCLVLLVELHLSAVLVRYHGFPSLLQLLTLPLVLSALTDPAARARLAALRSPVLLLLAGDAALRLATALWAASPEEALASTARSTKAFVLAAAIALLTSSAARLRLAAWTMVGAGAALGSLALLQAATGRYEMDFGGFARIKQAQIWGDVFEPRVAGPLGDPNFFAQAILVLIPIGLALGWSTSRLRTRATAFALTALLLVTVGLTYSRGAVVATAVAVALAFFAQGWRWQRLAVVAGVGLVALLLLPQDLERRLTSLREVATEREAETLHPDSSFAKRRLLTRAAWEMFLERPLLGVGAGNFTVRYAEFGDRVGSPAPDYDDPADRAFPHSLVLEIAAESGLVGLALWGGLLVVAFSTLLEASRDLERHGQRQVAILARSLAAALVGFLVAGLFLHLQFERHLWLLFGLIAGISTWSRGPAARARALDPGRAGDRS